MNRPAIQPAAIVIALLSICPAMADEAPPVFSAEPAISIMEFGEACASEQEKANSRDTIPSWLLVDRLAYVRAEEGQAVPLNSVIVMPSPTVDKDALLIIEFSRADLNEAFVQAVFFDRQALIPVVHPYLTMGVEYLLTDERLILKIHTGVIFHLRDDFEYRWFGFPDAPDYQKQMFFNNRDTADIFKSDDVAGRAIVVSGDIYVSDNPERVSPEFHGLYVMARDGSLDVGLSMVSVCDLVNDPIAARQLYPPRVLPGR